MASSLSWENDDEPKPSVQDMKDFYHNLLEKYADREIVSPPSTLHLYERSRGDNPMPQALQSISDDLEDATDDHSSVNPLMNLDLDPTNLTSPSFSEDEAENKKEEASKSRDLNVKEKKENMLKSVLLQLNKYEDKARRDAKYAFPEASKHIQRPGQRALLTTFSVTQGGIQFSIHKHITRKFIPYLSTIAGNEDISDELERFEILRRQPNGPDDIAEMEDSATLPYVGVPTFTWLAKWLYTQSLDTVSPSNVPTSSASNSALPLMGDRESNAIMDVDVGLTEETTVKDAVQPRNRPSDLLPLVKLWRLAEKLQMKLLQDICMLHIQHLLLTCNTYTPPQTVSPINPELESSKLTASPSSTRPGDLEGPKEANILTEPRSPKPDKKTRTSTSPDLEGSKSLKYTTSLQGQTPKSAKGQDETTLQSDDQVYRTSRESTPHSFSSLFTAGSSSSPSPSHVTESADIPHAETEIGQNETPKNPKGLAGTTPQSDDQVDRTSRASSPRSFSSLFTRGSSSPPSPSHAVERTEITRGETDVRHIINLDDNEAVERGRGETSLDDIFPSAESHTIDSNIMPFSAVSNETKSVFITPTATAEITKVIHAKAPLTAGDDEDKANFTSSPEESDEIKANDESDIPKVSNCNLQITLPTAETNEIVPNTTTTADSSDLKINTVPLTAEIDETVLDSIPLSGQINADNPVDTLPVADINEAVPNPSSTPDNYDSDVNTIPLTAETGEITLDSVLSGQLSADVAVDTLPIADANELFITTAPLLTSEEAACEPAPPRTEEAPETKSPPPPNSSQGLYPETLYRAIFLSLTSLSTPPPKAPPPSEQGDEPPSEYTPFLPSSSKFTPLLNPSPFLSDSSAIPTSAANFRLRPSPLASSINLARTPPPIVEPRARFPPLVSASPRFGVLGGDQGGMPSWYQHQEQSEIQNENHGHKQLQDEDRYEDYGQTQFHDRALSGGQVEIQGLEQFVGLNSFQDQNYEHVQNQDEVQSEEYSQTQNNDQYGAYGQFQSDDRSLGGDQGGMQNWDQYQEQNTFQNQNSSHDQYQDQVQYGNYSQIQNYYQYGNYGQIQFDDYGSGFLESDVQSYNRPESSSDMEHGHASISQSNVQNYNQPTFAIEVHQDQDRYGDYGEFQFDNFDSGFLEGNVQNYNHPAFSADFHHGDTSILQSNMQNYNQSAFDPDFNNTINGSLHSNTQMESQTPYPPQGPSAPFSSTFPSLANTSAFHPSTSSQSPPTSLHPFQELPIASPQAQSPSPSPSPPLPSPSPSHSPTPEPPPQQQSQPAQSTDQSPLTKFLCHYTLNLTPDDFYDSVFDRVGGNGVRTEIEYYGLHSCGDGVEEFLVLGGNVL